LNADYYNDYADTLREVKRYDDALEMARQAIAMDPSMILAYETLSQIYEEMGQPEDAAAAMEQADALRVAEK
jgi:superkiller protein 3